MEIKIRKMFFIFLAGIFVLGIITPSVLAEDCVCKFGACAGEYEQDGRCGLLKMRNYCCKEETQITEQDPDNPPDEPASPPEEETCIPEPEVCDGIDNDCDGRIDEGCEEDNEQVNEGSNDDSLKTCPEGCTCHTFWPCGIFYPVKSSSTCEEKNIFGNVKDGWCCCKKEVTEDEEENIDEDETGEGEVDEVKEIPCNMDSVSPEVKRKYDLIVCRESRTCSRYTELPQYTCEDENKKCYGYIWPDDNYNPSGEPQTQETYKMCSDGKCIVMQGEGEDECNENGDCLPTNVVNCVKEGEEGSTFDGDPNNDVCCEGLEKVKNAYPSNDEGCIVSRSGFVCTNCGDGNCGLGENECNCPEDCQEETISLEGTETMKIKGKYFMLNERFPDENYDRDIAFYTGVHPTEERVRSLINFELSDIENLEIIKAELVINNVPLIEMEDAGNQKVTLHRVTQDWTPDKVKWNDIPRYDEFIVASNDINENKEYSFDITSIMDYLIEYKSGVLLKAQDENQIGQKRFDDAYLNVWYHPENIEEEEETTCEEMGGKCRFLFGCRNQEIYTEDYLCPFWSRCCMPEQETKRPVDLSDYPYPFIESNIANFVMVIGVNARADDTIAATDILSSLGDTSDDKQIEIPPAILDTELANIYSQNTIIIGGPCVNNAAAELLGLTANQAECTNGFEEGKAKIKLFQELEGQEDKVILLVAGNDGLRTRIASKVLANYKEYGLEGQEVVVSGENLNDITITHPGENIEDDDNNEQGPIDCGKDFDCFIDASKECIPAEMDNNIEVNILGVLHKNNYTYKIKGVEDEKCIFYIKTESINLEFPEEISQETVDEQNEIYDALEGRDGECRFDEPDLTEMLEKWKQGSYSSGEVSCELNQNMEWECNTEGGDFENGECKGTYFINDLCLDNDGKCPPGCNAENDNDCEEESGEGNEIITCESDEDCEGIVCPQVVGQDTPLCDTETNECYCGSGQTTLSASVI